MSRTKTRAPYVYRTKTGRYSAYVRIGQKLVYVGTYQKWINACIAYNVACVPFGGLLRLQARLSKKTLLERYTEQAISATADGVSAFDEFLATEQSTHDASVQDGLFH